MAELAVNRPFDERYLDDDFRAGPVRTQARQADRPGERRCRDLEGVQPGPQIQQQLRIEAGAHFPGKYQVGTLEIADEQRAETDARTLGIGETPDHEVLHGFAFHFEPVWRTAVLVGRTAALRDHPFPPFARDALPR